MTPERGASLRTAGLVAGAVVLAIVALALHPHVRGHAAPQTVLREMGALSLRDRLVHGTLILLLGALLAGFANYAVGRGFTRQPVVTGLVSFAVGIGGLMAAGLIDGFILPEIVARSVGASSAAQDAALATIAACFVAVNVLTTFGIVAMAIAIGAWSLDLVRDVGERRIAGIAGFASAVLTIAALATGGPSLTSHKLIAVAFVQGAWYIWIAVLSHNLGLSRETS